MYGSAVVTALLVALTSAAAAKSAAHVPLPPRICGKNSLQMRLVKGSHR
jgi:hypothetical protein